MKRLFFPSIITLITLYSCEPQLAVTDLPEADFNSSRKIVSLGNSISFTDNSSNDPRFWFWDFGDNTTSNLQNPEHIYQDPGVYSVKLTIINNAGIDSVRKSNLINVGLFDIDSNFYKVVKIGTQYWSAENLKATRLNDGSPIPYIQDAISWRNSTTSAYCWYNNDLIAYKNTHGALYNGYTIKTEKVCPVGWDIPTKEQITTLYTYLGGYVNGEGGYALAGGKLKSLGSWINPNTGATNSTGFNALASGKRAYTGDSYSEMGRYIFIWTSTPSAGKNWICLLAFDRDAVYFQDHFLSHGFSVRCIKK